MAQDPPSRLRTLLNRLRQTVVSSTWTARSVWASAARELARVLKAPRDRTQPLVERRLALDWRLVCEVATEIAALAKEVADSPDPTAGLPVDGTLTASAGYVPTDPVAIPLPPSTSRKGSFEEETCSFNTAHERYEYVQSEDANVDWRAAVEELAVVLAQCYLQFEKDALDAEADAHADVAVEGALHVDDGDEDGSVGHLGSCNHYGYGVGVAASATSPGQLSDPSSPPASSPPPPPLPENDKRLLGAAVDSLVAFLPENTALRVLHSRHRQTGPHLSQRVWIDDLQKLTLHYYTRERRSALRTSALTCLRTALFSPPRLYTELVISDVLGHILLHPGLEEAKVVAADIDLRAEAICSVPDLQPHVLDLLFETLESAAVGKRAGVAEALQGVAHIKRIISETLPRPPASIPMRAIAVLRDSYLRPEVPAAARAEAAVVLAKLSATREGCVIMHPPYPEYEGDDGHGASAGGDGEAGGERDRLRRPASLRGRIVRRITEKARLSPFLLVRGCTVTASVKSGGQAGEALGNGAVGNGRDVHDAHMNEGSTVGHEPDVAGDGGKLGPDSRDGYELESSINACLEEEDVCFYDPGTTMRCLCEALLRETDKDAALAILRALRHGVVDVALYHACSSDLFVAETIRTVLEPIRPQPMVVFGGVAPPAVVGTEASLSRFVEIRELVQADCLMSRLARSVLQMSTLYRGVWEPMLVAPTLISADALYSATVALANAGSTLSGENTAGMVQRLLNACDTAISSRDRGEAMVEVLDSKHGNRVVKRETGPLPDDIDFAVLSTLDQVVILDASAATAEKVMAIVAAGVKAELGEECQMLKDKFKRRNIGNRGEEMALWRGNLWQAWREMALCLFVKAMERVEPLRRRAICADLLPATGITGPLIAEHVLCAPVDDIELSQRCLPYKEGDWAFLVQASPLPFIVTVRVMHAEVVICQRRATSSSVSRVLKRSFYPLSPFPQRSSEENNTPGSGAPANGHSKAYTNLERVSSSMVRDDAGAGERNLTPEAIQERATTRSRSMKDAIEALEDEFLINATFGSKERFSWDALRMREEFRPRSRESSPPYMMHRQDEVLSILAHTGSCPVGQVFPFAEGVTSRVPSALRDMDRMEAVSSVHKIGVVYNGKGDSDLYDILGHSSGSYKYHKFVLDLGEVKNVAWIRSEAQALDNSGIQRFYDVLSVPEGGVHVVCHHERAQHVLFHEATMIERGGDADSAVNNVNIKTESNDGNASVGNGGVVENSLSNENNENNDSSNDSITIGGGSAFCADLGDCKGNANGSGRGKVLTRSEVAFPRVRDLLNLHVVIVWNESGVRFDPAVLEPQVVWVQVVISPTPRPDLFRVKVFSLQPEKVSKFGPLVPNEEGYVVSEHALCALVRATAVNASIACSAFENKLLTLSAGSVADRRKGYIDSLIWKPPRRNSDRERDRRGRDRARERDREQQREKQRGREG